MARLKIEKDSLATNPTPRVPVALCIDTSHSMSKDGKIDELVRCINAFYDAVEDDDDAADAAEIAIVQFDSDVSVIQDFALIEDARRLADIPAQGQTSLGQGVNLALDVLDSRKKKYNQVGRRYFQPWLVLMTDGQPYPPSDENLREVERAVDRIASLVGSRKLTVVPVGIGPDADVSVLERFSPAVPVLRLETVHFGELFEWIAQSVSATTQNTEGAEPEPELSPALAKRVHGFENFQK